MCDSTDLSAASSCRCLRVPLTALRDLELVDATVIDDAGWSSIHRARPPVTLTCRGCGGALTARVSKYQTRHFYHRTRVDDCPSIGESADHLRLKALTARSILRAGARAVIEASPRIDDEGGWRADVLAEHSSGRRVAFEVQLAAMTVAEGQERTDRYQRDGIATCWVTLRRSSWFGRIPGIRVDTGDSIAYVTSGLIRWIQTQGCWYLVTDLVSLDRVVALIVGGEATPRPLERWIIDAREEWGVDWSARSVAWARLDDQAAADLREASDREREERERLRWEREQLRRERADEQLRANTELHHERLRRTLPVAVSEAQRQCDPGQHV